MRDDEEVFAVTNSDGGYSFDNLVPGDYVIRLDLLPGWTLTVPQSGFHQVLIDDAETILDIDFGIQRDAQENNSDPQITSSPPETIAIGSPYRYEARASDPDGDPLEYDLVVGPDGAGVSSTTGVLVWQPALDELGTHDLILRVRDSNGGVALQAFQVEVSLNSSPVITSTPVTNAVAGFLYRYPATAQDADSGDILTFSLESPPAGMNIDTNSGLVTWIPPTDELGDHFIEITVDDGKGGIDEQTYTLTVFDPTVINNDPPSITSTPRFTTGIEDTYVYTVKATDPNDDPLTFGLDDPIPAGMEIDPEAGVLTWVPTGSQLGDHPIVIRVEDTRGGFASQNYTLSVIEQTDNTGPEITSVPGFSAIVDQEYQYDAIAEDADGDPVAWLLQSGPEGLSLNNELGQIRWQPTVDQIGFHEVILQVIDIHGASATQGFGINVRAANSPPMIISAPPTTAFVGEAYQYAVQATDADGNKVTFSLGASPSGMSIEKDTGRVKWVPAGTQVGSHAVEVNVSDNNGGVGTQSYTLEVIDGVPNQPPVITSTPSFTATVGVEYQYQIIANDPELTPLDFRLLLGPKGMDIQPNSSLVTWTPTIDQVGENTVQVAVFDAENLGASRTFIITVREANQPPTLNNSPSPTAIAGQPYAFNLNVADPENDPILYTLDDGPQEMAVDNLGRLTWAPTVDDVGLHRIDLTIKDDRGAGFTFGYDLTVVTDTTAPQIALNVNKNPGAINDPVIVTVDTVDNLGIQSVSLQVDGTSVALNQNGQATLTFDQVGTVQLTATVVDTSNNSDSTALELQIIDPTDVDAPFIEITTPDFDSTITAPVNIIGTVRDDNLVGYTLSVIPFSGGSETIISTGINPVENDVLGKLDPTLLRNDSYILRLAATDGGITVFIDHQFHVASNLKVGNFTLSFVDLTIPVSGIPITIGRTYDTLDANVSGDFGFGWRLNLFDIDLRANVGKTGLEDVGIFEPYRAGTKVYVRLPDGRREAFTVAPKIISSIAGGLLFIVGDFVTLDFIPNPGVTSTLELSRDITLILKPNGDLINPGSSIPFNPASSLFQPLTYTLTTLGGLTFQIDPVTGKANSITDRNNNQLVFDENGVTHSSGKGITFNRDAQGRIISIIDPMGIPISFEYDEHGDLVSVLDREENMTQFDYREDIPHYLEKITDPLGRTGVRSEYDEEGRLMGIDNETSGERTFEYDLENFSSGVMDSFGNTIGIEYDEFGKVIAGSDPLENVTLRSFDGNGYISSLTDATGRKGTFTHDQFGRRLSQTDPLGNTRKYVYNSLGQLASKTNALGNSTTYQYDQLGNMLTRTNSLGETISLKYDQRGNIIAITDPQGGVTQFEYDEFGNSTVVIDALGNETEFTYDANGNMLTESFKLTSAGEMRTLNIIHQYDLEGNEIKTIFPDDRFLEFDYDTFGNRSSITNSMGKGIDLEYADGSNISEVKFVDSLTNSSTLDDEGRYRSTTDRMGKTSRYEYYENGTAKELIFPDLTPQDPNDNPRFRYEYDKANRLTSSTDLLGNRREINYDLAGRPSLSRDALGNEESVEYDANGQITTKVDKRGNKTRFEYDSEGRIIEMTFPDNKSFKINYDSRGNRSKTIDALDRSTEYQYDALNRLVGIQDSTAGQTDYTYDERGNLTSHKDANRHQTDFEYNGNGQRTAVVRPLGQRMEIEYNELGAPVSITDFNEQTVTLEYDDFNRLVRRHFPNSEEETATYTVSGRVKSITSVRGNTIFQYDSLDRLIAREEPDGTTISYTYNAANLVESITTPWGSVHYTYDILNRLETVTDASSGTTTYAYDPANNIVRTEMPDGTLEIREYDSMNRVTLVRKTGPTDNLVTEFIYTHDEVGNIKKVDDHSGREVIYNYDDLNRLITEEIDDPVNGSRTIAYSYDSVGNRLSKTDSLNGITNYTYDENDRLLEESNGSLITTYEYDNNGNTTLKNINSAGQLISKTSYEWDFLNRLTAVSIEGSDGIQEIQYEYDFQGNRISQIINGVETRFLVDSNRSLSQVLAEYHPNGEVQSSFVYGAKLISQTRESQQSFYCFDGQNDVRALTDSVGTTTDTYAYSAFGELQYSTGDTKNRYLFNGEQFDEGLQQTICEPVITTKI